LRPPITPLLFLITSLAIAPLAASTLTALGWGSQGLDEERAPFLFSITVADVDGASLAVSLSLSLSLVSPLPPDEFYCTMENRYGRASTGPIALNISGAGYAETPLGKAYRYDCDAQVRLKPFGPKELYPHDSYLLNLSFVFDDGGFASPELIGLDISCADWAWRAEGSLELRRASPQAAVVIRIILRRITSLLTPYYVVLFTSSILLGASLLIGPDALASRLALYLSLLFSVMSLLGQVSSTAPEGRAFSLAEYVLIDVCVATSLLCVESVLEYLFHEHLSPGAYGRAQAALKLLFSSAAALIFIAHFWAFSGAPDLFPWTGVPLSDFVVPGASVLSFALVASYTEHKRTRTTMPFPRG